MAALPGPVPRPDNTAKIDALLKTEYRDAERVRALNDAVREHRWHTYKQRRSLMARLRAAETANRGVLSQLTKLGETQGVGLYTKKKQQTVGGLNIRVELSLDGLAFSNPGPIIPHSAHIWVRATIDEAHRGEAGYPKTHEMLHVTWSFFSGYHPRDVLPKAGHDEYFVSYPLILTREFDAPSSGSTKHDFFIFADLYEPVNVPIGTST